MRPDVVIVVPPIDGFTASFEDRDETMRVEPFVSNLAVQRFDLRVLRWFSGFDEM